MVDIEKVLASVGMDKASLAKRLEATDAQMTPEQMKEAIKQRGWTNRSLAERWGKSETWISKIVNNPERDRMWDDAVRGLPQAATDKRYGRGAKTKD